jgi:hypothetical protein
LLPENDVAEVSRWLESPLGSRITQLELIERQDLEIVAPDDRAATPDRRGGVLRRLEAATFSAETVVDGILAFSQASKSVDTPAQRANLVKEYRELSVAWMAVRYRSLSLDELEAYGAFAESEAGRRYHQAVSAASIEVFQEVALGLGLGALTQGEGLPGTAAPLPPNR